ncbi:uncharacterized protein LOC103580646 [Microplitis demolitor]|uniref:uncharacterized protein LOC103580646 n=1 Tax=Microplitis demolitor TaxID=69319 RepID=UPI0004CCA06F|nr:uncharacterized protein LOC103580646 [Microplitis demolitor]
MHFILTQLLLALTASAVPLIDIGQLYDQKLQIPFNAIDNSNDGVDIGELFEYKKSDPINYPPRFKRRVEQLSDVSELGSIDSSNDIGQLYDQNSQTITDDVNKFQNNGHDIDELYQYNSIDTTNYPPRSKRSSEQLSDVSKLEYKDGANDIDQLYDQNVQTTTDNVNKFQNKGLDIDELYQSNSIDTTNYPPRSKRSNEQLSDVSKLGSKSGSKDIGQLYDQNSPITIDDINEVQDNGHSIDELYQFNSIDTTNYPPRSKRSNEQLSDASGLEINNSGINHNDAAAFNIRPLNENDIPVIDIGSLYDHERKIPRNELPGSPNNPGPLDLEDLYQYNGNYPVYPKH